MLKIILIVAAIFVVVFVVIVSMQPANFKVSRSATISAPSEVVFAQVNDLHKFQEWSPWAKLDPNAKMTYEGPSTGVGARCAWEGNSKVGAGSMTVAESRPNELIRFDMAFLKPFKANNAVEFVFKGRGNQTDVTWNMTGTNNFFFKAFSLFMDCDKMVGPDFERGLANLNQVCQLAAK